MSDLGSTSGDVRRAPRRFLVAIAAEPWSVGRSDCIGAVARWIETYRGLPAGRFLPPPDDLVAAARLQSDGGLLGAMRRAARDLGLREIPDPYLGDVAHVAFPRGAGPLGGQETAAVFDGRHWLAVKPGGRVFPFRRRLGIETIWSLDLGH
jgi:hypothetical protein